MKEKLVCHKSKLSFSADGKPRREPIPNVSNLKKASAIEVTHFGRRT